MIYLSRLLPYDPSIKKGKRLQDGIKEYQFLLVALEEVCQALSEGRFDCFDPLVGENACQIRAVKLAVFLLEHSSDIERLSRDLSASRQIIENFKISSEETSLRDLLNEPGVDIQINDMELYLVKSYLLTKVKTLREQKTEMPLVKNEYTDYKKIKALHPIGSMFAESLIQQLRQQLSAKSVQFVQKIAARFSSSRQDLEMISDKYLVKHRGLDCLPCYWMTKFLMEEALFKKIPLVIVMEQKAKDRDYEIIEKMTLCYEATSDGYKIVPSNRLDKETPALVFVGTTCREEAHLSSKIEWEKEFIQHNPIDLILAYAATHRQYPKEDEPLVFDFQDQEYDSHKQMSNEWGCSYENPSLFFLVHAYCDKIKNLPPFS